MINKESVQQRLHRDGNGISFTEFSYSLLQSYDFVMLNQKYNCLLQIGGSDQWGNIVAGIDLTRRMNQSSVFGLTLPLITKTDGTKFGKTESGAIWLDPKKTSPYAFYQFWLGVADNDVYRFLRYFTFLSIDEIDAIEAADRASHTKPQAQQILAEAMTTMIHGPVATDAAKRIASLLFSNDLQALTLSDCEQLAQDGLPTQYSDTALTLVDALVLTQLAKSKTEARTFISSGAVSMNGQLVNDSVDQLERHHMLYNRYLILRRGKKHYAMIRMG
jgi:tyrosyl-tRNA synthetase